MYQNDVLDPTADNHYDNIDNNSVDFLNETERKLEETKRLDKGYNTIYRKVRKLNGKVKLLKKELYSSFGLGSYIRDAETGSFYKNKVGSLDENLFFKVSFSTGEINSKNGSNSLFYMSPQHYMKHLKCELSQDIINNWERKRDTRLSQLNKDNVIQLETIVVK